MRVEVLAATQVATQRKRREESTPQTARRAQIWYFYAPEARPVPQSPNITRCMDPMDPAWPTVQLRWTRASMSIRMKRVSPPTPPHRFTFATALPLCAFGLQTSILLLPFAPPALRLVSEMRPFHYRWLVRAMLCEVAAAYSCSASVSKA